MPNYMKEIPNPSDKNWMTAWENFKRIDRLFTDGFILNQTSATQTAGFNISGSGTMGALSATTGAFSGNVTLSAITSGAWNGTAIGPTYGGTGLTSYTTGDLIYSSATDTLAKRTIGTNGHFLKVSSGLPAWSALTSGDVTGALGFTPASSSGYTANRVLLTNASGVVATAALVHNPTYNSLGVGADPFTFDFYVGKDKLNGTCYLGLQNLSATGSNSNAEMAIFTDAGCGDPFTRWHVIGGNAGCIGIDNSGGDVFGAWASASVGGSPIWVYSHAAATTTFTGTVTVSGNISATNLSGTNTGDQTITLTGDVTGSGTGSFGTSIANDTVTFAKMQNVLTDTFLGRSTAGTGDIESLSTTTARTMLSISNVENTALSTWSGSSSITTVGNLSALTVASDSINITTAKTPASASATGATGTICWDSSYLYVCMATDTWKRVAIATW